MNSEALFHKISQKNSYSLVMDLLDFIKAKGIAVGEKLPDENTLAVELHASRPSLREALKILEAFGIIDCRRGSGNTYISSLESGYNWLLALYTMIHGNSALMDFVAMRAAIEVSALDSFFDNAAEEDYRYLEYLFHHHLTKASSEDDYVRHHIEFHQYLLKYYNNALARDFIAASIRMTAIDPEANFKAAPLGEAEREDLIHTMKCNNHQGLLAALTSGDRTLAKETLMQHIFLSFRLSG